jgi:hypothetical protein
MRIQQMSLPQRQQASRAKPVPPELAAYIERANILPAPEELPGAVEGDLRDHYWDDEGQIEALAAQFAAFQGYLEGADLKAEIPVGAVLRCRSLASLRAVLRTIARMDDRNLATKNLLSGSHLEDFVSGEADQDGKFLVTYHPLLRALEGVEIARIRECPTCGKIFWAGRIDQPCCTKRCAGIRRTRLWRGIYPDKYKQQRFAKAQQADAGQAQAAVELERKKLESIKAPTSARRAARLPIARRK